MRILHVIPSVNPAAGGTVEGIKQLARVLISQGHTVEIASLDAPDASWLAHCPTKVHALGPGRRTYGYSERIVPWLKTNKTNYDAVVADGIWQFTSFAVWQALHNSSTPYYVFTHGMLDPWFKKTYPLKHLKKCLYWPWAEYRVLRDAQAVCFTCEEERVLAKGAFWPYAAREAIVNYGTSAPEGDPKTQREIFLTRFSELRDKRIFLFLARIHPKKGCDLLIEAFATVAPTNPAYHLVIAGPDEEGWQAKLREQAEALGIGDRITWTGMLSGDEKWGAFHASDAFVLPSHQENFGIVVAEALSCGLPVLISNKVNIWREIEEGGAGFISSDTAEGTSQSMQKWLAASPESQEMMRKKSKTCFLQNFEIHRSAELLLKVLEGHVEPSAK